MDKFEVARREETPDKSMVTFNVHKSAYEVVRQMSKESGRTMMDIFDMMVDFCAERFIVIDK